MLDGLARFVYRRRGWVAVGAIVFFVVGAGIGGSVAGHLDPYGADDPATESVQADELLQDHGYRPTSVVILIQDAPVDDPQTKQRVESIERDLRQREQVARVTSYYDTGSRDFVSRGGDATYLAVALSRTLHPASRTT
jgi:predicted RND superfamily exporter protein